jgi:hypothetical protein
LVLDHKKKIDFQKDYHQLVSDFLDVMKLRPTRIAWSKTALLGLIGTFGFQDKSPYKSHIGVWLSSGTKDKVVLAIMFISKKEPVL